MTPHGHTPREKDKSIMLPAPETPLFIPLEDRILEHFKGSPRFTFKEVRAIFPTEQYSDKTIYRAIGKLEKEQRIRLMQWYRGKKVYTAVGISELPHITKLDGETVPISVLIKHISEIYGGYWKTLNKVDDLPILLSMPFALAQLDDSEFTSEYRAWLNRLLDTRQVLTTVLGYIESLIKHPSMQGDVQYFKKIFAGNDPAMPTPAEITEFKRWVSNEYERKV